MTIEQLKKLDKPQIIEEILAESLALGFDMSSEPLTGSLLKTLAASKPGGRFLELGSGAGLSTSWILSGMDEASSLVTVDYDQALLDILKRHLGHDQRLEVVCQDGDDFIAFLEGRQFDFIFADTWSGKYRLLDETLAMVKKGGFYIIDDMLPQDNWPEGHEEKAKDLIAYLEGHSDFHVTKLAWASGLMILVRK